MIDHDERLYDVLIVERIPNEGQPMIGRPFQLSINELAAWLSRPVVLRSIDALSKEQIEALKREQVSFADGVYIDNRKKKELGSNFGMLTYDFDHSSAEQVAAVLEGFTSIVYSTFKSTPAAPRCRAVIPMLETVDCATKETAWKIFAAWLRDNGLVADPQAKDAGRLNFGAIVPAGRAYEFRFVRGELLDARRMIAANPPPPRPEPRALPTGAHRDAYVRAALSRALSNVQTAPVDARHATLRNEAYSLARLGLTEAQIADALIPAFVVAAGEARRHEGERTVRDAVRARRAA